MPGPGLAGFTTVPQSYAETDAESFVTTTVPGMWADAGESVFALEFEGRFAGTMSLRDRGSARAEVGFGAHPDVRGSGVAERGLRLLIEWGLEEHGLETIVWCASRGKWASRKLAWRVGFSFDGHPATVAAAAR